MNGPEDNQKDMTERKPELGGDNDPSPQGGQPEDTPVPESPEEYTPDWFSREEDDEERVILGPDEIAEMFRGPAPKTVYTFEREEETDSDNTEGEQPEETPVPESSGEEHEPGAPEEIELETLEVPEGPALPVFATDTSEEHPDEPKTELPVEPTQEPVLDEHFPVGSLSDETKQASEKEETELDRRVHQWAREVREMTKKGEARGFVYASVNFDIVDDEDGGQRLVQLPSDGYQPTFQRGMGHDETHALSQTVGISLGGNVDANRNRSSSEAWQPSQNTLREENALAVSIVNVSHLEDTTVPQFRGFIDNARSVIDESESVIVVTYPQDRVDKYNRHAHKDVYLVVPNEKADEFRGILADGADPDAIHDSMAEAFVDDQYRGFFDANLIEDDVENPQIFKGGEARHFEKVYYQQTRPRSEEDEDLHSRAITAVHATIEPGIPVDLPPITISSEETQNEPQEVPEESSQPEFGGKSAKEERFPGYIPPEGYRVKPLAPESSFTGSEGSFTSLQENSPEAAEIMKEVIAASNLGVVDPEVYAKHAAALRQLSDSTTDETAQKRLNWYLNKVYAAQNKASTRLEAEERRNRPLVELLPENQEKVDVAVTRIESTDNLDELRRNLKNIDSLPEWARPQVRSALNERISQLESGEGQVASSSAETQAPQSTQVEGMGTGYRSVEEFERRFLSHVSRMKLEDVNRYLNTQNLFTDDVREQAVEALEKRKDQLSRSDWIPETEYRRFMSTINDLEFDRVQKLLENPTGYIGEKVPEVQRDTIIERLSSRRDELINEADRRGYFADMDQDVAGITALLAQFEGGQGLSLQDRLALEERIRALSSEGDEDENLTGVRRYVLKQNQQRLQDRLSSIPLDSGEMIRQSGREGGEHETVQVVEYELPENPEQQKSYVRKLLNGIERTSVKLGDREVASRVTFLKESMKSVEPSLGEEIQARLRLHECHVRIGNLSGKDEYMINDLRQMVKETTTAGNILDGEDFQKLLVIGIEDMEVQEAFYLLQNAATEGVEVDRRRLHYGGGSIEDSKKLREHMLQALIDKGLSQENAEKSLELAERVAKVTFETSVWNKRAGGGDSIAQIIHFMDWRRTEGADTGPAVTVPLIEGFGTSFFRQAEEANKRPGTQGEYKHKVVVDEAWDQIDTDDTTGQAFGLINDVHRGREGAQNLSFNAVDFRTMSEGEYARYLAGYLPGVLKVKELLLKTDWTLDDFNSDNVQSMFSAFEKADPTGNLYLRTYFVWGALDSALDQLEWGASEVMQAENNLLKEYVVDPTSNKTKRFITPENIDWINGNMKPYRRGIFNTLRLTAEGVVRTRRR